MPCTARLTLSPSGLWSVVLSTPFRYVFLGGCLSEAEARAAARRLAEALGRTLL